MKNIEALAALDTVIFHHLVEDYEVNDGEDKRDVVIVQASQVVEDKSEAKLKNIAVTNYLDAGVDRTPTAKPLDLSHFYKLFNKKNIYR